MYQVKAPRQKPVGLPRTLKGYMLIWVVIDRLTKSAHFTIGKSIYTANKWGQSPPELLSPCDLPVCRSLKPSSHHRASPRLSTRSVSVLEVRTQPSFKLHSSPLCYRPSREVEQPSRRWFPPSRHNQIKLRAKPRAELSCKLNREPSRFELTLADPTRATFQPSRFSKLISLFTEPLKLCPSTLSHDESLVKVI
ncbi:ty3-gypsy retrotransposon protein [Cucumis melo var. makuwa]|uniref:Ty3-gypsy retrotransposon protein n=1 Tax=Cucumis melo var. makuwa TaxID=1194695 RepID=A0A5D3DU20_CUCMM|nr:ty3-gypsy retrotransposon protein [Cucumis melo var. makuwa]